MLRILFSFLPFTVCTIWLLAFLLNYHKFDSAKKTLTWYVATCVILYFCHAFYFTSGLPLYAECIWTFCSLSVYPLYYYYICKITSNASIPIIYLLFPGITIAVIKYIYPNDLTDYFRQILFAIQVLTVCIYGYRKLKLFDAQLVNVYADTEGRNTELIKKLLIAIISISCLSATANVLGRNYFDQNDVLIVCISSAFSALQYALCYIGFTRQFTQEEYLSDTIDDNISEDNSTDLQENDENPDYIGEKLEILINQELLYLTPNLKITDVSKRIGCCRTYLSNYINNTSKMSFSDYINSLRVEYAKSLMIKSGEIKLIAIAEASGFSTEQAFYRNFRKFTGFTPKEWCKQKTDQTAK